MTFRMCADKGMSNPAVAIHGRPGWCHYRETPQEELALTEFIFFQPNGSDGIWLKAAEFRDRMKAIRAANRKYYEDHPGELTRKIRQKRPETHPSLRGMAGIGFPVS